MLLLRVFRRRWCRLSVVVVTGFLVAGHFVAASSESTCFDVATRTRSYFALDGKGDTVLDGKGFPIPGEKEYTFVDRLCARETAVVIMDPWQDMPSDFLNTHYKRILNDKIVPLAELAAEKGVKMVMLTNDPRFVSYSTKTSPELEAVLGRYHAERVYHGHVKREKFAQHLKSCGIKNLIYVGFASNICILDRELGMVPMLHQGFRLFFVPEASAACEFGDTWQTQEIHKYATVIISQSIARLIAYDALMAALKNAP
ncbi:isochorismatase family protein [Desulfolutivibrio sulfoxidireducens]|nr:isochorismatase family protein [Desulfolutivibrio sulfoxidireducens]